MTLYFRSSHIGQPKSLVAAQAAKELNPRMRVHGLTSKLSAETEDVFDSRFWSETDVVVTALVSGWLINGCEFFSLSVSQDNVEARQYVDSQCVRHGKWLLESGTLGTKGNAQVVVPHVTESYSASADLPEEALALCTLKTFPYQVIGSCEQLLLVLSCIPSA